MGTEEIKQTVFVALQLEIKTDPKTAESLRYLLAQAEHKERLAGDLAERFSRLRGVTGGTYEIEARLWVK